MNQDEAEHYEAQRVIQRDATDAQQRVYAPQLHEQVQQTQAILVEQTNPKKIVDDIMLRLRGMRRNPDGTEVVIAQPKMNKIGIENMWFILDSHINQNIILSHLDKREIGKIIMSLQDDLVDDLSLNWKVYEIKNKTDLDAINNSILVNIFLALKRAEGQNEKNWLSKISVENITNTPRLPRGKKEGFWDKFKL